MCHEITVNIYGATSIKPHSQYSLVYPEAKSRDYVYVCVCSGKEWISQLKWSHLMTSNMAPYLHVSLLSANLKVSLYIIMGSLNWNLKIPSNDYELLIPM